MVKDHSDSEKGNPLPPHRLLLSIDTRVLLYAPSHRQDNTYNGLCYTSRGALAGTRNSSMGPPHEGSIRRPIAPWANALPLSYVPLQLEMKLWKHLGSLPPQKDKTVMSTGKAMASICWEGRKELLFNDALNTFYLRLYGF